MEETDELEQLVYPKGRVPGSQKTTPNYKHTETQHETPLDTTHGSARRNLIIGLGVVGALGAGYLLLRPKSSETELATPSMTVSDSNALATTSANTASCPSTYVRGFVTDVSPRTIDGTQAGQQYQVRSGDSLLTIMDNYAGDIQQGDDIGLRVTHGQNGACDTTKTLLAADTIRRYNR
jgi:hypothetical protein